MPGFQSPHGTVVYFDGVEIGYLTGYDIDAQAGQLSDSTDSTATVIGTGTDARVLKKYSATVIEPPSISMSFFGAPSFTVYDVGHVATLEFTSDGFSISGEAVLTGWNHGGRVGQYTTGSASFQLTGVLA